MQDETLEQQIWHVQFGIEQCIAHGMTQAETMATLYALQSYSVAPELTLQGLNSC